MARTPTPKPLSARQQEILDLLTAQPDMPLERIADLLETTPIAIKQQIGKIRSSGREIATPPEPDQPPAVSSREPGIPPIPVRASNGSIEDRLKAELDAAAQSLVAIRDQRTNLATAEEDLTVRVERLTAAKEALEAEPKGERHLSAVSD